jgi:HAD superfamily hydrolase (TIGR01509 family)
VENFSWSTSRLNPGPWEHDVLYDVFASHSTDYSPSAPESERLTYYSTLSRRVLERMGIASSSDEAAAHAEALWDLLGPSCFGVFPDALKALPALRARGIPVAVVSNWQSGLSHFCAELGLGDAFEHVLSSADFGVEKPDERIFLEACNRLGVPPERTLHVGDTHLDDYIGAESAGLQAVLIDRTNQSDASIRSVRTLTEILDFVVVSGAASSRAT